MRKRLPVVVALALALATIVKAADNPFAGMWKLNVAKSQNGMTIDRWKSGTVKIEAQEGGHKWMSDYTYENQRTMHTEHAAKYDGKDYTTGGTGGSYFDSVSITKIDENTLDFLWKKEGKEAARWKFVLSKDGKTATVTMKYTGLGLNANQVMFLERQ